MLRPAVTAAIVALQLADLIGCSGKGAPEPLQVASQSDRDDAGAALLMYAYREGLRDAPPERQMTCIAVEGGADPDDRLLRRLSGYGLKLRKGSACRLEIDLVVETVSQLHGALLRLESLRMLEPGKAIGEASCLWGRKAGIRLTCTLEYRLGKWEVVQETGRAQI
jgi:hypothetical protein